MHLHTFCWTAAGGFSSTVMLTMAFGVALFGKCKFFVKTQVSPNHSCVLLFVNPFVVIDMAGTAQSTLPLFPGVSYSV